jgi:hypothetical protein
MKTFLAFAAVIGVPLLVAVLWRQNTRGSGDWNEPSGRRKLADNELHDGSEERFVD